MSDGNRMPLSQAEELANALVQVLKPVCQRVEIAGSIRRKKATIGDIEIVCIPKEVQIGLFGEKSYDVNAIYIAMKKHGYIPYKGGEKYIAGMKDDVQHDVFVATRETWGSIFMIRTGPSEFTHTMVTQQAWGGYCPFKYYFFDGRLIDRITGSPIDTSEEEMVFKAMGMDFIAPEERQ